MTERDPALEPFDALIGTWAIEATHPAVDAVARGTTTFEWLEGGQFLIQRSRNDEDVFPDSLSGIGRPEAGQGLGQGDLHPRGPRRARGWPWSTSTRAACGGPTASRSRTACCAYGATTPGSRSGSPPRSDTM